MGQQTNSKETFHPSDPIASFLLCLKTSVQTLAWIPHPLPPTLSPCGGDPLNIPLPELPSGHPDMSKVKAQRVRETPWLPVFISDGLKTATNSVPLFPLGGRIYFPPLDSGLAL